MAVTTRSSDASDQNLIDDVNDHRGAGPRREAVETPFRLDADRDFDGQREDTQYLTSTSGARDDFDADADW